MSYYGNYGKGTYKGNYNYGKQQLTVEDVEKLIKAIVVGENEIIPGSIGAIHIKDGSINNAHIQHLAVSDAHIQEAAINRAHIADLAVSSAKIDDLAVTSAKIAESAIKTAHIEDAAITTAKIQQGSITTALIEEGAIGTAQIADGSITDAKIVELTANKITAGTLDVERLRIVGPDSILYEINVNNVGELTASEYTLDGGAITERSITADRIVAEAITAAEIASESILTNHLVSNAVTADKIASDSIESRHIKANSISTDKISSLTADKIVFDGHVFGQDATFNGTVEGAEIKTSRFEYEDAFAKLIIGDGPWLDIISKMDGFNTKITDGAIDLATGPYEDDERLSLTPSNIVNHNKHLTIMAEDYNGSLLPVRIRHADIEAIGDKAIRIHGGNANHTYIEFYRSWTGAGRSAYMGYGSAGTSIFTFRNDLGDFDFQSFVRVNRLLNRNYNNANLVRTYTSGAVDVNAGNGPLRLGYEGTTYVQIHASQLRHEYAGDFYIRPFPGYDIRVADKDGTWRYVRAAGLIESSSRKFKKNIRNYEENALEKIITTPIRWFHFKEELDEEFPHVGVIMEESPAEIVDIKGEGVSPYAMTALSWKAIQQLWNEVENIKERLPAT